MASTMGVMTSDGGIVLAVMPFFASSDDSALVSAITPPFDAA